MFYYLISVVGQTFGEGLAGWHLCSIWHGRINLVLTNCPRDWFGRRLSVSLRCLVSWRDCFQLSSSFFPCGLLHHGSQTFYMVVLSSKRTKWKLSVVLMARPRVFCVILVIFSWSKQSQPAYLREKRTVTMLQCRVSESMWSYEISHSDSHMILWLWLCLPLGWNLNAFIEILRHSAAAWDLIASYFSSISLVSNRARPQKLANKYPCIIAKINLSDSPLQSFMVSPKPSFQTCMPTRKWKLRINNSVNFCLYWV